jgi:exonuclease III
MDGADLAQRVRRLDVDGTTDAWDHPPVLLELDC